MNKSLKLKFYLTDRFSLTLILIGFCLGLGAALLQPVVYEASLEITLAKISYRKAGAAEEETKTLIVPSVPEAKRLILKPDEITDAILVSCGYLPQDKNRIKLARAIKAYRSDINGASLFIVVNIPQRDRAAECALALSDRVISFSELEKKHELSRLMSLSGAKVFSVDAHISRPIMVSDISTSRPIYLFFGILLSVILFGHICRKLFIRICPPRSRA